MVPKTSFYGDTCRSMTILMLTLTQDLVITLSALTPNLTITLLTHYYYQVTHLTPVSDNSLLTQQASGMQFPWLGVDRWSCCCVGWVVFTPPFLSLSLVPPSPCARTAVMSPLVYSLCYCRVSTMALSVHTHPHSSPANVISHWTVDLLSLHGATQWQRLWQSSIKLLTSS